MIQAEIFLRCERRRVKMPAMMRATRVRYGAAPRKDARP